MSFKQTLIILSIALLLAIIITWNKVTNPTITEPVPLIPGTNLAEYTETDVLAHPHTVFLSCVVDNKYPVSSGTLGRYISSTTIQFYPEDET
jgi:hypothetical protein